jgi:hypothetical protein
MRNTRGESIMTDQDRVAALQKNLPVNMRGCIDCGWILDHDMVFDDVWSQAGLAGPEHCCLGCLERRLGRPLSVDDFPPCLVNRLAYAATGRMPIVLKEERNLRRTYHDRLR